VTSKKTWILIASLAAVSLTTPAVWAQSDATPSTCSNASLKGKYGFNSFDENGDASVGQISLNGAGKASGSLTRSQGGSIASFSFTGTYSVNADCTGTGTLNNNGGGSTSFAFVVDASGTHIDTVSTDAGSTSASEAMAQGTPTCTLAGVKGTYGFHGAGGNAAGLLALAGEYVLDGTGKLSGSQTTSLAGVASTQAISGTYTMASSCAGTFKYKVGGQTMTFKVVMVNSGHSALTMEIDNGSVVTSKLTMQ